MPKYQPVKRIECLFTHTHAINKAGTKARRYFEGEEYVAETDDEQLAFGHMVAMKWAKPLDASAPKIPLKKNLGAAPENKALETAPENMVAAEMDSAAEPEPEPDIGGIAADEEPAGEEPKPQE